MNSHSVFVYGSLRAGSERSMLLRYPSAKFIAGGQVSGTLYDLGDYPGLLLGESDSPVTGEVYEVDDVTLNQLDEMEAESAYRRQQVEVTLAGEGRTCWIYVPANGPEVYSDRPLITSGDWTEYARTKTDR